MKGILKNIKKCETNAVTPSFRGFTLVETFVAISILLIALVGPLTLAQQSLKAAYYARDEITAFYLAQEALEYVRAVRDKNYLDPSDPYWLGNLDNCISPKSCAPDFVHFTAPECGDGGCHPLYNDSEGLFQYTTSGTVSPFTRTLTMSPVTGSPNESKASVTVSWVSVGISRSFTLSEYFFDWK